jgi:DNA-binding NarL/FixJ family response regulator
MRTAIQDRRRLFRDGLCMLLEAEPDIEVIGTAATSAELIDLCETQAPEVAILQADAAAGETVRVASALRRRHRRLRIVGIYSTLERQQALDAVRAGVDALVAASSGMGPVLEAIRTNAPRNDVTWLEPAAGSAPEPLAPLTEREREVLRLVGTGATTREISTRLGISAKTVENHKHRIFSKLGVHNQAHAVSIAMRAGVLTIGPGARRAAGQ